MTTSRNEHLILSVFDKYEEAIKELTEAASQPEKEEHLKTKMAALNKAEQQLIYNIGLCFSQGYYQTLEEAFENDKPFKEWACKNIELAVIKQYAAKCNTAWPNGVTKDIDEKTPPIPQPQNESFQKPEKLTIQSLFGIFHGPRPEQKEQTQNTPSENRKEEKTAMSNIRDKIQSYFSHKR